MDVEGGILKFPIVPGGALFLVPRGFFGDSRAAGRGDVSIVVRQGEENMTGQVARAWVDAVNSHDPARIRTVLADDFIWELGGSSTQGADASAEAWRLWFIGFPDFTFDVLRSLVDGEFATLQVKMRGTHRGVFRFRGTHSMDEGLPPTGKAFDLPGCAVHQVQHGKIIRLWAYWDTATLLRQLGLLPGA